MIFFLVFLVKECKLNTWQEGKLFTWEAFSCNAWLVENEHKIEQKKCLKFDDTIVFQIHDKISLFQFS